MPPIAANTGRAACFGDESSPSTNSLLISKPTSRKKIAIRPSFIHKRRGYLKFTLPKLHPNSVSSKSENKLLAPELAIIKLITTHTRSIAPPADLEVKKSLNELKFINPILKYRTKRFTEMFDGQFK